MIVVDAVDIEDKAVSVVVDAVLEVAVTAQNRCSQPFVANVAKTAKCLLDQAENDQFSAVIVSKNKVAVMTDQSLRQRVLVVAETATWAVAPAVLRITAHSLPV